jgi:hypothetical protein
MNSVMRARLRPGMFKAGPAVDRDLLPSSTDFVRDQVPRSRDLDLAYESGFVAGFRPPKPPRDGRDWLLVATGLDCPRPEEEEAWWRGYRVGLGRHSSKSRLDRR